VKLRILRVLLRKEYLQIYRDKLMLRQMVMMPFIQLLLLSSAATFEVKTAHVYLVDRDHSETSRGLVDRLHASGRFQVVGASGSSNLADISLLNRSAGVILVIPTDFERDPFEPPVSVTVSVAEKVPAVRYWCDVVLPDPELPSPKSQA